MGRPVANRTKQILVFNIPCKPGCTIVGCPHSLTELRLIDEAKDGTRGVRVMQKHIPGSVTWLGGETREVDAFVLDAPDVKKAIASGALRLL